MAVEVRKPPKNIIPTPKHNLTQHINLGKINIAQTLIV